MSAAPFAVRVTAKPATRTADGGIQVAIASPDERTEIVMVGSVSELAAVAVRSARSYGKPCAVWISLHVERGRRPRKPPEGFREEARRIAFWYCDGNFATMDGMPAPAA